LRRFQEVEFSLVRDEETGKSKAMHVTGPKATVLRYISDNHYVPRSLATKELKPADGRILGEVARSEAGRFILIQPVQQGYERMLAPMSEVQTVGRTRLMPGDSVEFTVAESKVRDDHEDEDRAGFIATEVTRPGGKPFVFEGGDFGNYLRARSSLPSDAGSLEPVDADTGKQTGWIASYSNRVQRGLIEVKAPAGKRYQKIKFELAETNVDGSQASRASEEELAPGDSYVTINAGVPIEFEVKTAELDGEFDVIERRAVSITGVEGSQIPFRVRSVALESERRSYGRGGDDDDQDGNDEEEEQTPRRSPAKEPLDL
jgi:cold shock CspA family protein